MQDEREEVNVDSKGLITINNGAWDSSYYCELFDDVHLDKVTDDIFTEI